MRDKLIELLLEVDSVCDVDDCRKCEAEGCFIHRAVDHLISNGVTFATDNNVPCKCGKDVRNATKQRLQDGQSATIFEPRKDEESKRPDWGTAQPRLGDSSTQIGWSG